MNRIIHILTLIVLVFSSCVKESRDLASGSIVIPFNSESDIYIRTKATLPESNEKSIFNMYFLVFDANGDKIYSRWFDRSNLTSDVNASKEDSWQLTDDKSAGLIKVKLPIGSNYSAFIITNIDSDMVKISSDKLGVEVHNINDLLNFKAVLNQATINRSSYFPMTGRISNLNVTSGGFNVGGASGSIRFSLKRVDAKVRFTFRVVPGTVSNGYTIRSFTPLNWKAVNLPTRAYILSYEDRGISEDTGMDAVANENDYFASNAVSFEEFLSSNESSFSFYMLENRLPAKGTPPNASSRDDIAESTDNMPLWNKDKPEFRYAHSLSPYVVVNGIVEMTNPAGVNVSANVTYYIHLGNFSENLADFSVKRNTFYDYTVTVNGLNSIQTEIANTTSRKSERGDITISQKRIFECDAHYESRTITFNINDIDNSLSWYVKTPFSDGEPQIQNGEEIPVNLDYKWVKFRINNMVNGVYADRRRSYTPSEFTQDMDGNITNDGIMDIITLVRFLKRQKTLALQNSPNLFDANSTIKVTAFVDEYYYSSNPLTNRVSPTLWKRFVNQEDRYMHIFSNVNFNKDGRSRLSESVATIRQKSIISVYNTNESVTDLVKAWGTEKIDEHSTWIYYNYPTTGGEDFGNHDNFNGRLNTARMIGLTTPSGTEISPNIPWDNYMNFEVINAQSQLKPDYRYQRYACLERNRDNNGNGIIDKEELRWYLASSRQLIGMWMGADMIDKNTKLYNLTPEQVASTNEFSQFVMSSTARGRVPELIWAHEGSSISTLLSNKVSDGFRQPISIRCVRNLGIPDSAPFTETPSDYLQVSVEPSAGTKKDTTLYFRYLNDACFRYYSSKELVPGNELSIQNKLYKKITVYKDYVRPDTNMSPTALNQDITENGNRYCPEGYRLPNQRETVFMALYVLRRAVDTPCVGRIYYSMGMFGSQKTGYATHTYFGISGRNPYCSSGSDNTSQIRCVKDIFTE